MSRDLHGDISLNTQAVEGADFHLPCDFSVGKVGKYSRTYYIIWNQMQFTVIRGLFILMLIYT